MPQVALNIVTWNSRAYIALCLEAALCQSHPDCTITVFDNGSTDDTLAAVEPFVARGVRLIAHPTNLGYAAAHNRLIQATDGDYVLTLNPDVYLQPDFVAELVRTMAADPGLGSASGLLVAVDRAQFLARQFALHPTSVVDEAGLGIDRARHQYARGYRRPLTAEFRADRPIFGPCGAAAFYRRTMLEDICIEGECFDAEFFVHKEDVDLAWRAQLFGWSSVFVPTAVGYHVRGFHPGRRKTMSRTIRRHALQNRWLMTVKNELPAAFARDWRQILWYEIKIAAYLLLVEQESLAAYVGFVRQLRRALRWRRAIQARARRTAAELQPWFDEAPP